MYYRLNLFLKTFGFNTTASVTFTLDTMSDVDVILAGYKPLIVRYQLFHYITIESTDTTFCQRRVQIH